MKQAAAGNGAAFNNALQDSSFVQRIDPRLAQPYLDGFSQAMSTVFLVATFILLIAFVVSFFLPHVELRASSAYNERGGDERRPRRTPSPADAPAPTDAVLVSTGRGGCAGGRRGRRVGRQDRQAGTAPGRTRREAALTHTV